MRPNGHAPRIEEEPRYRVDGVEILLVDSLQYAVSPSEDRIQVNRVDEPDGQTQESERKLSLPARWHGHSCEDVVLGQPV